MRNPLTTKSDTLIREANLYTGDEITDNNGYLITCHRIDARFARVDARQNQIIRDMEERRRAGIALCPLMVAEFDATQAEMQSLNIVMRQVDAAAYRIRCAASDRREAQA